jgi:pilus assembly protein Flp/PilA
MEPFVIDRQERRASVALQVRATTMNKAFASFLADETGATAIEYALMCLLIALPIIAAVTVIGKKLSNSFNAVSSNFS